MKKQNVAFTLVELTISIFISAIIIVGVSITLLKISQNFTDNNNKVNIFNQVSEFIFDTNNINFNSGRVYSGGILLYNNNKAGVLIGSFLDEYSSGYNYKLNYDDSVYKKYYLGYFIINQNTLSGILNDSLDINNLNFNNGKIYDKLIIKDLKIKTYNTGSIFELNINFFKNYIDEFNLRLKQEKFIKKDDYLKINFYF